MQLKSIRRVTQATYLAACIVCLLPFVTAPMALIVGFLFTLLLGNPFAEHVKPATSWLLKVSVVGLGFGMKADSALRIGLDGFWLTLGTIVTVLVLGYFMGKALGLPRCLSHLIASGTAICGGSAIAAVAPTVQAKGDEVSISLGVVFFLNSIALLLFPFLGHLIGLSEYQFGLWSAIAIHDTSSVVGAASAYGSDALEVATTVKLARALWIIPVSLISAWMFRSGQRKISIPWFIFLFIIALLLNSYVPALETIAPWLVDGSKRLLVLTLFLVGSSLSIAQIRSVGLKPLFLGVGLWIVISIGSLAAILLS